jgi:predicted Fe-Mo cluster-binding NifX family protein
MNILIPVDDNDFEEAKITLIDDLKYWIFIKHNEGQIEQYEFYKSKDEIKEFIDIVILKNDKEYIWPFIEENIAILIAPLQRYVEDIIEAYMFKELHDINI